MTMTFLKPLTTDTKNDDVTETLPALSTQQIAVLSALTRDALTVKEAARTLKLSRYTIQSYIRVVFVKWEVNSLMQAYNLALAHGVLQIPEIKENKDDCA